MATIVSLRTASDTGGLDAKTNKETKLLSHQLESQKKAPAFSNTATSALLTPSPNALPRFRRERPGEAGLQARHSLVWMLVVARKMSQGRKFKI